MLNKLLVQGFLFAVIVGIGLCQSCNRSEISTPPVFTGAMECRATPIDTREDQDRHALFHFAISPLVETELAAQEGVTTEWKPNLGLSVRVADERGSLTVFAPFSLRAKERNRVRLELTSDPGATIQLEWTDERCPQFASSCQQTKVVS